MTLEHAKQVLSPWLDNEDEGLCNRERGWEYVYYEPKGKSVQLDGYFTTEQLEALFVYMQAQQ